MFHVNSWSASTSSNQFSLTDERKVFSNPCLKSSVGETAKVVAMEVPGANLSSVIQDVPFNRSKARSLRPSIVPFNYKKIVVALIAFTCDFSCDLKLRICRGIQTSDSRESCKDLCNLKFMEQRMDKLKRFKSLVKRRNEER